MKTQQQAEREEQQRIKNLVLNYDLRDDSEQIEGEADISINPFLRGNPNTKGIKGFEKRSPSHRDPRSDKSSSTRGGNRTRKLQLSDVDWYGRKPGSRKSNPP